MPVVPPYEPYLGIQDTMAECIPMIEQVATDEGLTLIDLFTRLNMEENYYSDDGIHPSKEGAGLIAALVHPVISGDFGGLQMHMSSVTTWFCSVINSSRYSAPPTLMRVLPLLSILTVK